MSSTGAWVEGRGYRFFVTPTWTELPGMRQCPICLEEPERAPNGSLAKWSCWGNGTHEKIVAVPVRVQVRMGPCSRCEGRGRTWRNLMDKDGIVCPLCEGRGWMVQRRNEVRSGSILEVAHG